MFGTAAVLLGSLLPWVRSGRRWRSSFSISRVLGHLTAGEERWWSDLPRWWPLVWPVAALTGLALVLERRWAARMGALLLAVVLILVGSVATSRSVRLGYGFWVTAGGTMLLVACSVSNRDDDVG